MVSEMKPGTKVIVIVRFDWILNSSLIRMFEPEVKDPLTQESVSIVKDKVGSQGYAIFGRLLNAEHPQGLMINFDFEIGGESVKNAGLFIPWHAVTAVSWNGGEKFSKIIGFKSSSTHA
jgi:hypothetical protein